MHKSFIYTVHTSNGILVHINNISCRYIKLRKKHTKAYITCIYSYIQKNQLYENIEHTFYKFVCRVTVTQYKTTIITIFHLSNWFPPSSIFCSQCFGFGPNVFSHNGLLFLWRRRYKLGLLPTVIIKNNTENWPFNFYILFHF